MCFGLFVASSATILCDYRNDRPNHCVNICTRSGFRSTNSAFCMFGCIIVVDKCYIFKSPNIVCSLVPSSSVDVIVSFLISGVLELKLSCQVSYRFCVFLPFSSLVSCLYLSVAPDHILESLEGQNPQENFWQFDMQYWIITNLWFVNSLYLQ